MDSDSIYLPLPQKSQTIRLLDILPGGWEDEVKVKLRETSIASARNCYTTISYTWGNINTTRQVFITCDGHRMPISENLFTIIRRQRRPNCSTPIWADALCINQTDDTERTHQVGLMGEIYRNSRETIIWLGEQTEDDDVGQRFVGRCTKDWATLHLGGPPRIIWQDDANDGGFLNTYLSDYIQCKKMARATPHMSYSGDTNLPSNDLFGAFCLLSSLAQGTSSLAIEFLEESDVRTPAGFVGTFKIPKAWYGKRPKSMRLQGSRSARVWAGMERLMSRAWWTRIWVIQETVLAQKATVHFGMLSAPWSMFAKAAAHYEQERHNLCLDLAGTLPGHEVLSQFSTSVTQIENVRRYHQSTHDNITLLSLLWKFRSQESSDKRDKAFALLGLTTDWQGTTPIVPDYRMNVEKTFIEIALNAIRGSKSLSILAGDLDAGLGRKRLKDIPSWVMDWALPCLQLEVARVDSLSLYNACGSQTGLIKFHEAHSILDVEGVRVDDIISIGDISRHTQISDTVAIIRQWNLMAKEPEAIHSEYPSGGTYKEAFWRTLLGDIIHTGHASDKHLQNNEKPYRRAKSSDFEAFEAWRLWSRCISRDTWGRTATFSQRDLDEGISSIHYALKTATASRRFFITRKGYIGIGPKSTGPGDGLYVVKNSKVPFIVRPDSERGCGDMSCITFAGTDIEAKDIERTCLGVHDCRRLIGDCFVYGLMDGEALRQPDSQSPNDRMPHGRHKRLHPAHQKLQSKLKRLFLV